MRFTYLIVVAFFVTSLYGQEAGYVSNYSWEATPNYETPIDSETDMLAVMEKYVTEFAYAADRTFTEYYLEHKAYWLNSNDKIEDYNKIYLPYDTNSILLESKARVITSAGKVIDLDNSKILTAYDEESGKNYKYFAFEGVEKGSIIEYYYKEKKDPSYNGTAFRLQSSFDKKVVEFDLFSPANLVFQFRTYNGLPDVVQDTTAQDRLHWQLKVTDLKALSEEAQAPYQASRGYLVYKLDKNLKTGKGDLSSYSSVAQNLYNFYYAAPDKAVEAQLQELITSAVPDTSDPEATLRLLDNAIKSGFTLSETSGENLSDLAMVLEQRVANTTGLIKLYVGLLNTLKIKHEMVLTSDRQQLRFDKDFEAHNFLTDFLIYFPDFDTYLSPTDMFTRYGYPPGNLMDNYGLFIKEVKVGDFTSAIGKIKYITPIPAEKTEDKMVINIRFDPENISSNQVQMERSFSGYYGMQIHPYMHLAVGEEREKILEGLVKTMDQNAVVNTAEVRNEDPELFGVQPIQFALDFTSDAFMEKAGRKYLFKIGELIGPQIAMYQEKKRELPYENDHNRSYYRTLRVELPKGYRIANLDDLNIDNTYEADGKELFSFTSYYEVQDNVLQITADEHYRKNSVSPALFEEFRTVINSAADFNKITLILEPEG
ncbi:MAG: DUF3857 domain-containing protein [Bacteroidota bacterium]